MANALLSQAFGSGGIKSVQRGTVDMQGKSNASPANVTITSVDPAKAFLIAESFVLAGGVNSFINGKMTSATNLQFTPYGTLSFGAVLPINWQVVEFL